MQPRDTTWGYINTPAGRAHIMAGDWIVTGYTDGRTWLQLVSEQNFRMYYKAIEVTS